MLHLLNIHVFTTIGGHPSVCPHDHRVYNILFAGVDNSYIYPLVLWQVLYFISINPSDFLSCFTFIGGVPPQTKHSSYFNILYLTDRMDQK